MSHGTPQNNQLHSDSFESHERLAASVDASLRSLDESSNAIIDTKQFTQQNLAADFESLKDALPKNIRKIRVKNAVIKRPGKARERGRVTLELNSNASRTVKLKYSVKNGQATITAHEHWVGGQHRTVEFQLSDLVAIDGQAVKAENQQDARKESSPEYQRPHKVVTKALDDMKALLKSLQINPKAEDNVLRNLYQNTNPDGTPSHQALLFQASVSALGDALATVAQLAPIYDNPTNDRERAVWKRIKAITGNQDDNRQWLAETVGFIFVESGRQFRRAEQIHKTGDRDKIIDEEEIQVSQRASVDQPTPRVDFESGTIDGKTRPEITSDDAFLAVATDLKALLLDQTDLPPKQIDKIFNRAEKQIEKIFKSMTQQEQLALDADSEKMILLGAVADQLFGGDLDQTNVRSDQKKLQTFLQNAIDEFEARRVAEVVKKNTSLSANLNRTLQRIPNFGDLVRQAKLTAGINEYTTTEDISLLTRTEREQFVQNLKLLVLTQLQKDFQSWQHDMQTYQNDILSQQIDAVTATGKGDFGRWANEQMQKFRSLFGESGAIVNIYDKYPALTQIIGIQTIESWYQQYFCNETPGFTAQSRTHAEGVLLSSVDTAFADLLSAAALPTNVDGVDLSADTPQARKERQRQQQNFQIFTDLLTEYGGTAQLKFTEDELTGMSPQQLKEQLDLHQAILKKKDTVPRHMRDTDPGDAYDAYVDATGTGAMVWSDWFHDYKLRTKPSELQMVAWQAGRIKGLLHQVASIIPQEIWDFFGIDRDTLAGFTGVSASASRNRNAIDLIESFSASRRATHADVAQALTTPSIRASLKGIKGLYDRNNSPHEVALFAVTSKGADAVYLLKKYITNLSKEKGQTGFIPKSLRKGDSLAEVIEQYRQHTKSEIKKRTKLSNLNLDADEFAPDVMPPDEKFLHAIDDLTPYLADGTAATIGKEIEDSPDSQKLKTAYVHLAQCLSQNVDDNHRTDLQLDNSHITAFHDAVLRDKFDVTDPDFLKSKDLSNGAKALGGAAGLYLGWSFFQSQSLAPRIGRWYLNPKNYFTWTALGLLLAKGAAYVGWENIVPAEAKSTISEWVEWGKNKITPDNSPTAYTGRYVTVSGYPKFKDRSVTDTGDFFFPMGNVQDWFDSLRQNYTDHQQHLDQTQAIRDKAEEIQKKLEKAFTTGQEDWQDLFASRAAYKHYLQLDPTVKLGVENLLANVDAYKDINGHPTFKNGLSRRDLKNLEKVFKTGAIGFDTATPFRLVSTGEYLQQYYHPDNPPFNAAGRDTSNAQLLSLPEQILMTTDGQHAAVSLGGLLAGIVREEYQPKVDKDNTPSEHDPATGDWAAVYNETLSTHPTIRPVIDALLTLGYGHRLRGVPMVEDFFDHADSYADVVAHGLDTGLTITQIEAQHKIILDALTSTPTEFENALTAFIQTENEQRSLLYGQLPFGDLDPTTVLSRFKTTFTDLGPHATAIQQGYADAASLSHLVERYQGFLTTDLFQGDYDKNLDFTELKPLLQSLGTPNLLAAPQSAPVHAQLLTSLGTLMADLRTPELHGRITSALQQSVAKLSAGSVSSPTGAQTLIRIARLYSDSTQDTTSKIKFQKELRSKVASSILADPTYFELDNLPT